MNKEEFYKILHKPQDECDGCDMHLRYCFNNNNWKSIFYITGLDFSHFGGERKDIFPVKRWNKRVRFEDDIIITTYE